MTKSKKRPIISSKSTDDEDAIAPAADSAADSVNPVVTVAVETKPTIKEKKPPATKKATNKKGKNGKLSNVLSANTFSSSTDTHPVAQIANIILHLKCSMHDLNSYNEELSKQLTNPLTYNPSVPPDIMAYHHTANYSELNHQPAVLSSSPAHTHVPSSANTTTATTLATNTFSSYDQSDVFAYVESNQRIVHPPLPPPSSGAAMDLSERQEAIATTTTDNEFNEGGGHTSNETSRIDAKHTKDMKDIHTKLKKLKISLFKNMAFMDKKSACFWCTYDFDNPECYIPRYEMDGAIHGYGSFCRPECAAAYLMKENLDDSTKFERYHLLNHIYSKVYDYKRNIKPAPNPYYMLEKYYGNLTIQEYRKLLKSDHLLLVIDKPLTRILPELHEDNEEFLTNIYGVTTTAAATHTKTSTTATMKQGVYKVRRQSDKPAGPTKSNILKEHFGIK